jgi:hypothetical protein
LLGLAMALQAGCQSTPTTAQHNIDPLTGARTPPGSVNPPPPANTTAAHQAQATNQGAPPIPKDLAASNTATIAGTSWQKSPASLAINDRATPVSLGTPGQLTNDVKTPQAPAMPGFPAANPNPRVEAIPDAKPNGPWQTIPTQTNQTIQTANAAPASPTDLLAKQLQDRGVIGQKQETLPSGTFWYFYVSRNGSPVSIYSTVAPDYVTAAQAILKEIP